jgi:hypothetical protein
MKPQPEYSAEMTLTFEVGKASMSRFMDALSLMLSNPYITTESVIITKKE